MKKIRFFTIAFLQSLTDKMNLLSRFFDLQMCLVSLIHCYVLICS